MRQRTLTAAAQAGCLLCLSGFEAALLCFAAEQQVQTADERGGVSESESGPRTAPSRARADLSLAPLWAWFRSEVFYGAVRAFCRRVLLKGAKDSRLSSPRLGPRESFSTSSATTNDNRAQMQRECERD